MDPLTNIGNQIAQAMRTSPLAGMAKGVDLEGLGRMLNPRLPKAQAAQLDSASSGIQAAMNGSLIKMTTKGDPAKAGQLPGTVDQRLARANADKAISQIDWSKPVVGLWVPGTGGHGVDRNFAKGLGGNASTVAIDYPSNFDMPNGVSTGMETARLVIEEAARRGKQVNLGGHSQGAWVAGEVMAQKGTRAKVHKAVLFGHPTQANAQYDHGKDPKVREINNRDDPYTQPTVDVARIGAYLAGVRRPNGSDPHGYDFSSQGRWLAA